MSDIKDQPQPTQNESRPIWELVIEDMRKADPSGRHPVILAMIRDAKERHQLGCERYGIPLQAGNGRDAMIDAYQETQDQVAYLRQACEEGIDVWAFYAQALATLRDLRMFLLRRDDAMGPICCGFCGRQNHRDKQWRRVLEALVCADPETIPDKPTPTPCAWKFCARATAGEHNFEGDAGNCRNCGRPREVSK